MGVDELLTGSFRNLKNVPVSLACQCVKCMITTSIHKKGEVNMKINENKKYICNTRINIIFKNMSTV